MRSFQSPDGTLWAVDVKVPSHSSAMLLFKHPDGEIASRDRYAWHNSHAAEASDPRARLRPAAVLDALSDQQIARLFRRSMPVYTERPGYVAS
jgi:hypothetical protein